jgi:hypothetical protein
LKDVAAVPRQFKTFSKTKALKGWAKVGSYPIFIRYV